MVSSCHRSTCTSRVIHVMLRPLISLRPVLSTTERCMLPMGCFSSKPAPDTSQPSPRQLPPPTSVPQQTQYRGENTELRQGYSPLDLLPQRPDPTPVPATPVHRPEESIPDPPQSDRKQSQKPRSSRPSFPLVSPGMSRAAPGKPLLEPGSSNHSSHSRPIARAASMDNARYGAPRAPPSSFGGGGHVGMDLDARGRPRADPATTGNDTRPFLLPSVREVLPEGFRYVFRS